MARLFNLALEETSEVLEETAAVEPQEEIEAIENAESAAADEAEIAQGTDEVTEAMEEVNNLQEQVDANEEVLAATAGEEGTEEVVPDAAADAVDGNVSGEVVVPESEVTPEQVTEATESLKYAIAAFGDKVGYVKQVQLASESAKIYSRRGQLKIANEGAKDFILKLIETAKRLIKQLYNKVVVWVKKMLLKVANYKKAIEGLKDKLSKVDAAKVDAKTLSDALRKIGTAEAQYSLLTSNTGKANFTAYKGAPVELKKALTAIIGGKSAAEALKTVASINVEEFGFKKVEGSVQGITGTKALVVDEKGYKSVSLEVNDKVANATVAPAKLIKSIVDSADQFAKWANDLSATITGIQKVQSDTQAELDKLKTTNGDNKDQVARSVEAAKSIGITACMFRINEVIGAVKGYVAVAKAAEKAAGKSDSKTEDKKEESK